MREDFKLLIPKLPEPYRSQLVANYDPEYYTHPEETTTVFKLIACSFSWCNSPEGTKYWSALAARANANEFDTPQPDNEPVVNGAVSPMNKRTRARSGTPRNRIGSHTTHRKQTAIDFMEATRKAAEAYGIEVEFKFL